MIDWIVANWFSLITIGIALFSIALSIFTFSISQSNIKRQINLNLLEKYADKDMEKYVSNIWTFARRILEVSETKEIEKKLKEEDNKILIKEAYEDEREELKPSRRYVSKYYRYLTSSYFKTSRLFRKGYFGALSPDDLIIFDILYLLEEKEAKLCGSSDSEIENQIKVMWMSFHKFRYYLKKENKKNLKESKRFYRKLKKENLKK